MGAIFDIPTGERSKITTGTVNIHNTDLNATGMLKAEVSYEATATDEYMEDQDRHRRRLFVDTSIAFAGHHEIWLSDSEGDSSTSEAMNIALYNEPEPFKKDEPPDWPDDLGDITL